jgi:hypothetical protein
MGTNLNSGAHESPKAGYTGLISWLGRSISIDPAAAIPGDTMVTGHDKRLTPRGEKIIADSSCSLLIFFYG